MAGAASAVAGAGKSLTIGKGESIPAPFTEVRETAPDYNGKIPVFGAGFFEVNAVFLLCKQGGKRTQTYGTKGAGVA